MAALLASETVGFGLVMITVPLPLVFHSKKDLRPIEVVAS
jgi:hypothetical protein